MSGTTENKYIIYTDLPANIWTLDWPTNLANLSSNWDTDLWKSNLSTMLDFQSWQSGYHIFNFIWTFCFKSHLYFFKAFANIMNSVGYMAHNSQKKNWHGLRWHFSQGDLLWRLKSYRTTGPSPLSIKYCKQKGTVLMHLGHLYNYVYWAGPCFCFPSVHIHNGLLL